ncbi:MAG TPA: peptidoglycan editing factor PgeF [Caulobacteraceae bacterium]|nr:peptidoglycan editing factor PgeF [Caulobacteraceae bacterium]
MSEVPTLVSPLLEGLPGVRHAFFTRQGGVSQGLFASLNVGRGSGDDPTDVAENRARAARALGRTAPQLSTCYQIHSARPVVTDAPLGDARPEGDAVVSRTPGVLCGALAADCAPVLIADPEARVVAAVHAGWRGALAGVVEAAVAAMATLGASPERMRAAVGPCIGPSSYEVGLEFLQAFTSAHAAHARFFAPGAIPEKRLFDLPGFVLSRLAAAGVTRAAWTGHDTLTDEARFFSNRRAVHRGERDYGRLLSAITLDP